MIRLVLSDVLAAGRVWVGAVAVAAAAVIAGLIPGTLIATGVESAGVIALAMYSIAGTVAAFCAVSVVVVLSSVLRLTVDLRRRSYALWQIVGVDASAVTRIVSAQLAVAGAAGAALGAVVGVPVVPALVESALRSSPGFEDVRVRSSWPVIVAVVLVVMAVILIAGAPAARRAGRTPPLEVLRAAGSPRRPRRLLRILAVSVLVIIAVSVAAGIPDSLDAGVPGASLLGPVLIAAVAAAGAPLVRIVARAWTALVPTRASASFSLARATTVQAERSAAAVAPLLIAIGLPTALLSAAQTVGSALPESGTSALGGVLLILGGPVVLAAVGAAATTFMSSQERSRDQALLLASGASEGVILLTAVWEAVIQVGTAALLAGAVVLAAAAVVALELSTVAPTVLVGTGWQAWLAVTALALLLVLPATLGPSLSSLRRSVPRALAAVD